MCYVQKKVMGVASQSSHMSNIAASSHAAKTALTSQEMDMGDLTVSCGNWHRDIGSRFCRVLGCASVPSLPKNARLGWDLRCLEGRSNAKWALCLVPRAILNDDLWSGRLHYSAG